MRRPFKFFFGVALGLIVFFFVAKVFIAAFIAAAIMSIIYFVFQKVRNAFAYEQPAYEYDEYVSNREFMYRPNRGEPLYQEYHPYYTSSNRRYIEVL